MTNQDAFDKMVAHLRKQGQKAQENGTCRYRTKSGLMCAVGCLLTDEDYRPGMEGMGVEPLLGVFDALPGLNEGLLAEMQDVHDSFDPSHWEEHFASTAATYGLVYVPPATPIQPATAA